MKLSLVPVGISLLSQVLKHVIFLSPDEANSQFNPEMIDEDFETELGHPQLHEELPTEVESKQNKLKERIDCYAIVNVCGTDKMGRPIIVVSACKLPDIDEILKEKEFFQNHQHFFEVLLE